jgi:hypothetical protein
MSSPFMHFNKQLEDLINRLRNHVAVESELRFWTSAEMAAYEAEVYEAFGLDANGFSICEQAFLDIVRFLVESGHKEVASSFVEEFRSRGYVNAAAANKIIASG